jgi:hypothetical protein
LIPIAVILYEDDRGQEKQFGLHALVLACVADDLGVDMFTLTRKLDGRPMKGVSNILQSCRNDIRRIGPKGQKVFALVDDDHIRHHLRGVDARADAETVTRTIKEQSDAPAQLEVILLKENTETVIKAAKQCDPLLPDAAIAEALRKRLAQRDRILNSVARAVNRAIRDCIRDKVPAIEELVRALAVLVGATPDPS